jgi:alpha-beta hydrolase superfamily lysophospholipase
MEKNLVSCSGKSKTMVEAEDLFYTASDGCKLFINNYKPTRKYNASIFIIAGITGINHHNEKDIIELLSNNENRVVVIHPRGTGYSHGVRGDISDVNLFISDYVEIIKNDQDYISNQHPVFLFGHSMSCAVLLAVADELKNINMPSTCCLQNTNQSLTWQATHR